MKKIIKWVFILAISIFIVAIILPKSEVPAITTDSTTLSDSILKPPTSLSENWFYSDKVDQMDGLKSYYAETSSTNSVDFKFPYEGGSTFSLVIQKRKKAHTTIYLEVSKGQFLENVNGINSVRVKIDDNAPFSVGIAGSSDMRGNVIFLESEKMIVQKLLKAKKLIIEAEFYQEGKRQAEFDVSGLKWPY